MSGGALRDTAKREGDDDCGVDVPGVVSESSTPGYSIIKKASTKNLLNNIQSAARTVSPGQILPVKVKSVLNIVGAVRSKRRGLVERAEAWIISKGIDPDAVRHSVQSFVAIFCVCMFMVGPAVLANEKVDQEAVLVELYGTGDTDGDGFLDRAEFVAIMSKEESVSTVKLANAFGLDLWPKPMFTWTAITVVLVIESNLGNVLKKSTLRALGTVLGGFLGWMMLKSIDFGVGFQNQRRKAAVMITLVPLVCGIATFLRDHIKKADYAFVVFLLTFVLVTLSTWNDQDTKDTGAWDRTVNIIVGCGIGAVITVIVLPVRATKLLKRSWQRGSVKLDEFMGTVLGLYAEISFGDGDNDEAEDAMVDELQAGIAPVISAMSASAPYVEPAEREDHIFSCGRKRKRINWAVLSKARAETAWAVVALLSELDTGIANTSLCVGYNAKINKIRAQFSECLEAVTYLTTGETTMVDAVKPAAMFAIMVVNFVWTAHDDPGTGAPKQTLMSLASALIAITSKLRMMLMACSPHANSLLNEAFHSLRGSVDGEGEKHSVVIAVMNAIGLAPHDASKITEPEPVDSGPGRRGRMSITSQIRQSISSAHSSEVCPSLSPKDASYFADVGLELTCQSNEEWC